MCEQSRPNPDLLRPPFSAQHIHNVLPCGSSDASAAGCCTLMLPCSKLNVYLPHTVQEDKGKAQWDAKKQVLSVTLPIIREDF